MNEEVDPRWQVLDAREWKCESCDRTHNGIFDLACMKPEFWEGPEDYAPDSVAATSSNCLTEDFCVLNGEHYFVRCVLRLPLVGAPGEYFAYGVWSTLSKKNFAIYMDHFDRGHREDLGPWFGWFSNRLETYPDTLNLKCQVHPQPNRQRPWIELELTEHPLAQEQAGGISYERLVEIYAANGHVMSGSAS